MLNTQLGQQSQFLGRMITFYEGVSPDLDVELNILLEHLDGKSDFPAMNKSMSKLSGSLSQNAISMKQQNNSAMSTFKNALATLYGGEDIQQGLRTNVGRLLKSLPKANTSLYALQPLFKEAIALYQKALENAQSLNKTYLADSPLTKDKEVHHRIALEFRELLGQISSASANDNLQSFREIQVMLAQEITHQQLLESFLVVIKVLISDLLKDRKHTRKIVTGLHQSLTDINVQAERSIEVTETQHAQREGHDASLLESIIECGNKVEQETDIGLLKAQMSKYLLAMTNTIEQGAQSSRAQQLEMMSLLSDMQTQLHKLEKSTAVYKNRLVEQEQRNYRDELTNIPNRLAYNERINVEYARWVRQGQDLCLVILDIDHFKRVNDNFGHAAGDKTLQIVAKNIASFLRLTDFLFRWGGEEFVLILTQSDMTEIKSFLDRIRRQIEQIPFKHKGKTITITVSIGATSFTQGDTIESAFERADESLFQAKNSGRNKSVIS